MPVLPRVIGEGRRLSSAAESARGRLRDEGDMSPEPFVMFLSMFPLRSEEV